MLVQRLCLVACYILLLVLGSSLIRWVHWRYHPHALVWMNVIISATVVAGIVSFFRPQDLTNRVIRMFSFVCVVVCALCIRYHVYDFQTPPDGYGMIIVIGVFGGFVSYFLPKKGDKT